MPIRLWPAASAARPPGDRRRGRTPSSHGAARRRRVNRPGGRGGAARVLRHLRHGSAARRKPARGVTALFRRGQPGDLPDPMLRIAFALRDMGTEGRIQFFNSSAGGRSVDMRNDRHDTIGGRPLFSSISLRRRNTASHLRKAALTTVRPTLTSLRRYPTPRGTCDRGLTQGGSQPPPRTRQPVCVTVARTLGQFCTVQGAWMRCPQQQAHHASRQHRQFTSHPCPGEEQPHVHGQDRGDHHPGRTTTPSRGLPPARRTEPWSDSTGPAAW